MHDLDHLNPTLSNGQMKNLDRVGDMVDIRSSLGKLNDDE